MFESISVPGKSAGHRDGGTQSRRDAAYEFGAVDVETVRQDQNTGKAGPGQLLAEGVPGVVSVTYNIAPKPPSTIEAV